MGRVMPVAVSLRIFLFVCKGLVVGAVYLLYVAPVSKISFPFQLTKLLLAESLSSVCGSYH